MPPHRQQNISLANLSHGESAGAAGPIARLREAAIGTLSNAPHVSSHVISSFVRVIDGLMAATTGLAIAGAYPGIHVAGDDSHYVFAILGVGLALPMAAHVMGLYDLGALLRPASRLTRLAALWSVIFALVTAAMFLTKAGSDFSRGWLSLWYLGGLSFLAMQRIIVAGLVRRWNSAGQLDRRAVLVGGGETAGELVAALDASHDTDVSIVGIFDDRDDGRSPATVGALPKLGNVAELVDFVRRARIDILIVNLPLAAEQRLLQVLQRLWILPVDIRLSAYAQKLHYRPRAYSYIGNVPFLDVFDKPLGDWGRIIKAVEDKAIATLAVVLLAPLMAAVALAIRLDSKGPVIFRQKRYGFNNELIEVYKFRSMYHDQSDADAARLVSRGDPRVTRVGRFIRRTSLDELPQLFNVLKGNLSLVGPRPHATMAKAADRLYTDVVDGYFARHKVKPGITGWAQINGWRGETDTTEKLQRRVEHDLYYIENWSLGLDLFILARTPISLLKGESAY
jgi:Undecaprenyl-phosphate glucose phosphotransferase